MEQLRQRASVFSGVQFVFDVGHLLFSQFRACILAAFRVVRTSLPATVAIIVKHSPKEQVCWIHAERMIAVMEHAYASWHAPTFQCPRHAVCPYILTSQPERTIGAARSKPGACPRPAFDLATAINMFPESARNVWIGIGRHIGWSLA